MYNQFNPWGIGASSIPRISRIPRINWEIFLNNTQRTLGIINQAIPIVNQMKPLVSNARTLFKIAGAMREENPNPTNQVIQNQSYSDNTQKSNLQFFL